MRRTKKTGGNNNGEPTTARRQGAASARAAEDEIHSTVDFLSPEFNRIDELDDNAGNFREFESLSGVVTTDMRFHEKRKRKRRSEDTTGGEPQEHETFENPVGEDGEKGPLLPLTVVSKGRLLIIDENLERASRHAASLRAEGLNVALCAPKGGAGVTGSTIDSFPLVEVDSVAVAGAFGNFNPIIADPDGHSIHLSSVAGQQFDSFDLILDLQSTPSYNGKQLPLGYYAPRGKKTHLQEAMEELPRMRGRFHKPQFIICRQSRCLHGRSRFLECLECVEACPVGAITPKKEEIIIDQYLCQGCGTCALACPADALEMHSPSNEELLSDILSQISAGSDSLGREPEVIFYDRQIDADAVDRAAWEARDRFLVIEVDEIGRIGLETLLLSLVHGAAAVTLLCASSRPLEARRALARQVDLGKEILQGLHWPAQCVRFAVDVPEGTDNELSSRNRAQAAAGSLRIGSSSLSFAADRRTLIRQATQLLAQEGSRPDGMIALQPGAPFGAIAIGHRCSLCMACVSACPSGALQSCDDRPRLSLMESRCHQCGLCTAACPEKTIELVPRLLYDHEEAGRSIVLRETEPFNCIECGRPFASAAMINCMQEKLKTHWMYTSDSQARGLQMCRTCRTREALSTGAYFA
jgi:ferredoxin